MLTDTLDNISELIGINNDIIPNIITFLIVVVLLLLTLKGQLELIPLLIVYFVSMTMLELLGISSVFNLITLVRLVIVEILNLVFMGVIYGY